MLKKPTAALAALAALAIAAPAHAAGQDGMVAVRDPVTGQLRAPTAAELRALRQQAPAQLQPARPRGVLTIRPDGSGHMRLGDSAMVYSVLTRDAAGKPVLQCVSSAEAAEAALHAASPAVQPNREQRHESR